MIPRSKADMQAKARELKEIVPALFIAMKRKETPPFAKMLVALTVAYALSPIDLIPDFIPVLGYLDDIIILPALIALAVRLIPADVLESCRAEAKGLWQDGKPTKWVYGLPVVMIWLLVAGTLLKFIIKAIAKA